MKLCLVITTRGNYAKVKSIIQAAQNDPDVELQIIVGGGAILAKYGNIADSLINLGVKVDRRIHFLVEGETPVTMAKSAGLAVSEFTTAFENLNPDIVMVIADRFECLSIAMTASYMNIPVAHMEGGEVSGSIDESIRHAITKLAHVHFPATQEAADRIVRMGEAPETVFPVGASSLDVIASLDLDNLKPVVDLQESAGVGTKVDISQPYLVVIQHPVTTEYSKNLEHVNQTLSAISELGMGAIWIWPNMDAGSDGISKGIRIFREKNSSAAIHFFKSLPIELYAPLLKNAQVIVGNSSSGIREAAFMGTPCVNIGSRQSGRDRSNNILDVGYDKNAIKDAIKAQLAHGRYEPNHMWGDGKAGGKMLAILKDYDFTIQKRITY
ncbi:MAG: UDP-N-acetylglucosamine 2-epimerase (hydrolyzing) [Desulfatibacillum sp.]|nr:UDP-N-acetylglucosamine 2-epimerase (hydrolyzing) [Desulfatibacillum sp.]